jgi:hypothetical protein
MGWTISHGTTTLYRSAGAMGDVARHVAHVLPATDWRIVQPMFDLAQCADGPFTIHADQAGRIGRLLHKAANHPLMPKAGADCSAGWVRELADAAQQAARTGQSWQWS